MTGNPAERFDRLNELFDELVQLEPTEREEGLLERCGGDAELASDVRALLAVDQTGDPDRYVVGVVASQAAELTEVDVSGQMLGPWRVVEPLGEGGMGTVYRAERADGAYEAEAAIKIVRGGVPSRDLDRRLRAERQILAGLSHPGISKLLDGGSTADGTPYLVMELVRGEPITDWCEERELTVDERLELMLKVCEAVAYAHGELVAHRDLKPSNILVTEDAEPKLLDFGIAKLMDVVEEGDSLTRTGSLLTPAYASPEQVSGQRAGVATDVYALGVLLYELLTGRLPLQTRGLTPAGLHRVVATEVPPLPSTVVEDADVRKRLAGDVDAVISRALRKEPEERYLSVRALADDLRRHLDGLPVQVRHDDWVYRMTKMLRRNAGAVSAGVLMFLSLLSFTVSTYIQSRTIAAERDRADEQRATAERVSAFLEELFTEADPNDASGLDVSAREVLDRGAGRVFEELDSEPVVQAALATVMGRVYRSLGEYESAEPLLDSGLVARQRTEGIDPLLLGESLLERGALAYDQGDYEEALRLSTESRAAFEDGLDGDDQALADAIDWMAVSLMALGRLEEAEPLSRENLAMNQRLHGEDDPDAALAHAYINLADILRDRGAYDEAIELGRDGLRVTRGTYGDVHLETAWALNQLASSLSRSGRDEEAVPFVEEGLAVRRTVFDGPHPETAASLGNLANILRSLGRIEEAEAARRESVEQLRAVFGDEHPYVAATMHSLGELLVSAGKVDEALATLTEALRLHRVTLPEGHPNLGYPLTALGRAALADGDPAGAYPFLLEAYETRRDGLPEGHWHVAASGLELGRALDGLGRTGEAEARLAEALRILTEALGADDPRTGQAREALHDHYVRRGMGDAAAALGGPPGR